MQTYTHAYMFGEPWRTFWISYKQLLSIVIVIVIDCYYYRVCLLCNVAFFFVFLRRSGVRARWTNLSAYVLTLTSLWHHIRAARCNVQTTRSNSRRRGWGCRPAPAVHREVPTGWRAAQNRRGTLRTCRRAVPTSTPPAPRAEARALREHRAPAVPRATRWRRAAPSPDGLV